MKTENNNKKVFDFQENIVSLQKNTGNGRDYSRTEAVAPADEVGERHERLGLGAFAKRGRPTLGDRWDTIVYEEGLQPQCFDDLLGSSRSAILYESNRLIEVAKQYGEFIPSTVWETFGVRNQKPSGESVVFLDEKNDRVVKFKDPFSYISLKNDNPYAALYEHHIHNYFFENTRYRFLGVSQDPVNKNVRFVFEQPFIKSFNKPSKEEIKEWLKKKDFNLEKDEFWYSDGYVSLTDVEGDNCIKGVEGEMYFIDPIIRFDQNPKVVIEHYIQKDIVLKGEIPPRTQQVIKNRVCDASAHSFTQEQVRVLEDYCRCFPEETSKSRIFGNLMDRMQENFDKEYICKEWIDDVRNELNDLAEGVIRNANGIKY